MKMAMACVFALLALSDVTLRAAPTPEPPTISSVERDFLALSEDDRKALQDALGWLGFYNGVIDGTAGKRTLDALAAYRKSVAAPADVAPSADEFAALRKTAAARRAAVGFRVVKDAATGIGIGVPLKLVDSAKGGGAGYASADASVTLTLEKTNGDLAGLFKTQSADAGARKASYKYLKAGDFFVVAGEDGDNKFYRRYAGKGGEIRGFAFSYPKKRAKALDPVALAIANAFDPFPARDAPATPAAPPPPPPPKLVATAYALAPGIAVTKLDAAACPAPLIAGKPVHYLDAQNGLTRLGGEFAASVEATPSGAAGDEWVALSLGLESGHEALTATPARWMGGAGVLAALPPSASGAPLFDRQGRLAGFVDLVPPGARRGQVPLAALHRLWPAAQGAGAQDTSAQDTSAALTMAEIARLRRKAVLGVFCAT